MPSEPEDLNDKKSAIYQATLELVSKQGFHGTPMSQIAKKADLSIGTIYHYFPSKEDLINALYIYVKQKIARVTLGQLSENIPVQEGFKQIFRTIIRYSLKNPQELSFGEQCENSPLITRASREAGMKLAKPLQKLFQRARAEKLLKDLPEEVMYAIILGAVISLAKLYQAFPDKLTDKSLNAGLEAIWDAVRK
jgi:AcrR family transcriptional regulator